MTRATVTPSLRRRSAPAEHGYVGLGRDGRQTPWRRLLVLLVRAVVVYGTTNLVTLTDADPVLLRFQHVLVWGGMHTVIPIALLLSVPRDLPFREDLVVLVFGVALLSIVGQGLLLSVALRLTGTAEEATDAAIE